MLENNNIFFDIPEPSFIESIFLGFPEPVTNFMEKLIIFHNDLCTILGGIAIFVAWMLFQCLNRYTVNTHLLDYAEKKRATYYYLGLKNYRKGDFSHDTNLEIIWTVVPAFVLINIAIPSLNLLYFEAYAEGSQEFIIDVVGNQWYWYYEMKYDVTILSKLIEKSLPAESYLNNPRVWLENYSEVIRKNFNYLLLKSLESKPTVRSIDFKSKLSKSINVSSLLGPWFKASKLTESFNLGDLSSAEFLEIGKKLEKFYIYEIYFYFGHLCNFLSEKFFAFKYTGHVLHIIKNDCHNMNYLTPNLPFTFEMRFARILTKKCYLYRDWLPLYVTLSLFQSRLVLDYKVQYFNSVKKFAKTKSNNWFLIVGYDSYMIPEEELIENLPFPRLLGVDNSIILIKNLTTHLKITSGDVLHSWSCPALGVKADACPGRIHSVYVIPRKSGIFYGQCSEICGANHGFMPIKVKIIDF